MYKRLSMESKGYQLNSLEGLEDGLKVRGEHSRKAEISWSAEMKYLGETRGSYLPTRSGIIPRRVFRDLSLLVQPPLVLMNG
jgi:hypothetical protein